METLEEEQSATVPFSVGNVSDLEDGEMETDGLHARGRIHLGESTTRRKFQSIGAKKITFFVSNFFDECSKEDLKAAFGKHGEVADLYIAQKKDSSGRNFAFVRFVKVKDVASLELSLKNMKIGKSNLFVRLARFDKGGKKLDVPGYVTDKPSDRSKASRVEDNTISIPSLDPIGFNAWSSASLLGYVLDVSTLAGLSRMVVKKGLQPPVIRYVTGLYVLLSFPCANDATKFINDKDWWSTWFVSMEVWKGQLIPFQRVAWIRITGVPLHLWDPCVFNKIGESFGKVVYGSQACIEDGNLASDCIGVLLKSGRKLSGEIKVRWKDLVFNAWIAEEEGQWLPDFLGNGCTPMTAKSEEPQADFEAGSGEPLAPPEIGLSTRSMPVHNEVPGSVSFTPDNSSKDVSGSEQSPAILETPHSGKAASGINFFKFEVEAGKSSLKRRCSKSRSPILKDPDLNFNFPFGLSSKKRARVGDVSLDVDLSLGIASCELESHPTPVKEPDVIPTGSTFNQRVDFPNLVGNEELMLPFSKVTRAIKVKRKVLQKSNKVRAHRQEDKVSTANDLKICPVFPP